MPASKRSRPTGDGALLVGAEGGERGDDAALAARRSTRATPAAPRIGYPLRGGFSLTALDRLPDGGFVALERFYAPVIGARARITRFPDVSLNARGEALPDVEELALLAPPLPIDNFEGIAAVRMPDGATRIYIVSDDNFSARQRTLLYAFDVSSDAAALSFRSAPRAIRPRPRGPSSPAMNSVHHKLRPQRKRNRAPAAISKPVNRGDDARRDARHDVGQAPRAGCGRRRAESPAAD